MTTESGLTGPGSAFEIEWRGNNKDAVVRVNGVEVSIRDCKIELGVGMDRPVVTLTAWAVNLKTSLNKADVRIVAKDPVTGAEISFGELLDLVPGGRSQESEIEATPRG